MHSFKTIAEYKHITATQFNEELVPEQQPVVIRNFASKWPLVTAAQQSNRVLVDYLCSYYQGTKIKISAAPCSAQKRFTYNDKLNGFTFVSSEENLQRFLFRLLELEDRDNTASLSLQSAEIDKILPGLAEHNNCELRDDCSPRLWIGNQGIVDTHYDGTDNLACVVAGKRQFVLFPPSETANLYPGPLDNTPAGVPVSLVDFANPDFSKYPLYKKALVNAYKVELNPGDAIYIPMLWWHRVESMATVNALVNYWWNGSFAPDAVTPNFLDSLKVAILAMRDYTPEQRNAWRQMFNHYLFRTDIDPTDYIPKHNLHLLGEMSPEYIQKAKAFFSAKIQHSINKGVADEQK